tara:strand:- start:534 stop:1013 length:480 start_codon:yes stop_codon:yes gene_type:complete
MELSQSTWVAIAFVIFFILIGRKSFKILSDILDQRKESIKEELEQAIQLREEAQSELNDSIIKQKEINTEIEKILVEAKETAKKIKLEAEEKAKDIVKRKEEQAKEKINASQADTIKKIKQIGSRVAILASENYIKENIDDASSKRMLEQTTKEINNKL